MSVIESRPAAAPVAPSSRAQPHRAPWRGASAVPRCLPLLALLGITLVAYLPVRQAGFIWDDDIMLTHNPVIHAADGLRTIWFGRELPDYFPLTSTVLWLEWRLFGSDPLGYHVVNVLLHALSAVLWWRVLRALAVPGAWLAAALFAVHPVNVESVAWITELKNTLAMVLLAGALLCWLRFEHAARSARAWYAGALALFVLALLSKTAVVGFFAVLLALAWWRRGRLTRRDVARVAPFLLAAIVLGALTLWFQQQRAIGGVIVHEGDFWSRLAGTGWAAWFYLSKALVPLELAFVYPRWSIDAANVFAYVPGLLVVAALVGTWRMRRRWGRGWFCGAVLYLAMLGPILGFFDMSYMRHAPVADRFQYFAIIVPLAFVAAGVVQLRAVLPRARGASVIVAGVLLVGGAALTFRQSTIYRDLDTLWRATLERNPRCAVAYNDLGTSLLDQGRTDEAIAHYAQALAILPGYALAQHNLGCAHLQAGDVTAAMERFHRALALQPQFPLSHHYLGLALRHLGRTDDAATHFAQALTLQPKFADSHRQLGHIRLEQGRTDDALTHFRAVAAAQPGAATAHNDLGVALVRHGDHAGAHACFARALELSPDFAEAHLNLGRLRWRESRAREAAESFRAAAALRPDDPGVVAALVWVLATAPDAAVRHGTQAIFLAQRASQQAGGDHRELLHALAAAYAEAGRFTEAVTTARRALALARSAHDTALAGALEFELASYESGIPIRDAAPANPEESR